MKISRAKRPSSTLAILILAALACRTVAPTPTPAAVPSSTPTLSATPTSSATPLPTATATVTPDAEATQSARVTQQAEKESADLRDQLEELGISTDTGSLVWYQLQPSTIELVEHNTYTWDLFSLNLYAEDFVVRSDVTWNNPGFATCGFLFRSEGNLLTGAHYIFEFLRLSGLPAWRIVYAEGNQFKNSPTDVQYSSAIDQSNGATNNIVLVAQGERFTVFINGVRQGTFYDYSKQRVEGKFAFYGWQDTGNSTCKFENTSVWAYK